MMPAISVGIAADHGGFAMKAILTETMCRAGFEVIDFGAFTLDNADDYPDFVVPLARAISAGSIERGVAICSSGVGATIAANKIIGVRAGLIHDIYSAHQGVEDDDMNVCCLGGQIIGPALALELIAKFLSARFNGAEHHSRRLAKVHALEDCQPANSRFDESQETEPI